MDGIEPSRQAAAALEAWLVASLPWLGAALLLATAAGVVGVFLLLRKLGELERLGTRLDALEEIRGSLARFVDQRGDLDLRRIEHALLEIRDGQKRLEASLMRAVEAGRAGSPRPFPAGDSGGVADRVIDRLLVLGYERIQLVTPVDELPAGGVNEGAAGEEEFEVLVEAHRNGVLCKGRAHLRGGALVDIEMKPAYMVFP